MNLKPANSLIRGGNTAPKPEWALLTLGVVWLATRGLAFHFGAPYMDWEVWEARKLLDYGFWNRYGAIINWHEMTGLRSDPWAFNYTNHPYPMLWLYTLIYYLFGGIGILAVVALVWFFGLLILYRVLAAQFGRAAAGFATLLYCLAPTSISFDANPNVVAVGAIVWPMVLWVLYLRPAAEANASRFGPWLCGLAVLLAGQISWFSLSVLPPLLWLTAPPNTSVKNLLRQPFENPYWKAMLAGALITVALFLLQLVVYTPSWKEFWAYFRQQSALSSVTPSRVAMMPHIGFKVLNSAGLALWFTAALAAVWMFRKRQWPPLAVASLLYLAVFAVAGLALTQFFYVEGSMYKYLLFPATILAAAGFAQIARRWLKVPILGIAVLSALVALMRLQASQPSQSACVLGQKIGELTHSREIVLTNLRALASPFPRWDTGAEEVTRRTADRLMRFGICDFKSAQQAVLPFQKESGTCVFVVERANPLSAELESMLEKQCSESANYELILPPEKESAFLRLRAIYWKATGRDRGTENSAIRRSGSATVNLRVFRLHSDVFKQLTNG